MARDRNERQHNWTDFADALDAWLYEEAARRRKPLSRRKLAEELGMSYAAVDSWFRPVGNIRPPTYPEPEAFWALVRVTGWEPEHLAELCGYAEVPPHVLGPWDFLREELDATNEFRATEKERIRMWIDEVALLYRAKPKRPGTRGKHRPVLAERPVLRDDITDEEALAILERMRHDDAQDDAGEPSRARSRSQKGVIGAGK